MINQIRAEFKKLLTVRTTYIFLLLGLAMTIFFAFYIDGYRTAHAVKDPHKLYSEVGSALIFLTSMFSFVGVLLVTNEYRHNTIMYTLTAVNRRLKVLVAKAVVVSVFAIITSLVYGALSPLLTEAGLHLKGIAMVHQTIPIWDTIWRAAFYGWGYAMLALVAAFIIRNQVGTIIALVLVPGTGEALLSLLLKHNGKYLPFRALGGVLGMGDSPAAMLPATRAAAVVCVYLIVGWIVAGYLFVRRDAN